MVVLWMVVSLLSSLATEKYLEGPIVITYILNVILQGELWLQRL